MTMKRERVEGRRARGRGSFSNTMVVDGECRPRYHEMIRVNYGSAIQNRDKGQSIDRRNRIDQQMRRGYNKSYDAE